jgi:thioredoxin-related protein
MPSEKMLKVVTFVDNPKYQDEVEKVREHFKRERDEEAEEDDDDDDKVKNRGKDEAEDAPLYLAKKTKLNDNKN